MQANGAKELLAVADQARSKTREARRGGWFALSVFGAIILAAAPLYIAREIATYPDGSSMWTSGGWWVSLYWVIAAPLAYLACVRYYRRRAERTGVAASVWPWIATGLGLLVLMTLVPPGIVAGWIPPITMGFTSLPILAIAAGLVVLAWLERNVYLAAFAILLVIVAQACVWIYDVFLGWHGFTGIGLAMIVVGLSLLCGGALMRVGAGRER